MVAGKNEVFNDLEFQQALVKEKFDMHTTYPIYTVEIDSTDKDIWSQILMQFNDASIYQSWSYGAIRWGESNLSHLVLRDKKKIAAAAQVRIVRLPFVGGGIAYVRWGGMWQPKNIAKNPCVFRHMVKALREEYVLRRGLFLRVLPNIMDIGAEEYITILKEESYNRRSLAEGGSTLYIDLRSSIEELRHNLRPRWRGYLNKAEKSSLSMIDDSNTVLYEKFTKIYREMFKRKRFNEFVDIDEFRLIQQDLPDSLKMKIMVCQIKNEVHAAIVCAAAGNMGIYVLGATSDKGLKSRGSYLLHWEMIKWLKASGYQWYDLGGIDPVNSPGTTQFKYGIAGKKGIVSRPIGQFDTCTTWSSNLAISLADRLRPRYRKFKQHLKRF